MTPRTDKRQLPDFYSDLSGLDVSDEVKKHLNIMLTAISNVSHEYIWYESCVPTEDEKMKEHVERVFAYELYYQWRKILESIGCSLYLNAEITKKTLDDIKNNEKTILFPDIVLHGGQDCFDANYQMIACEIKRSEGFSQTKFAEDIQSLRNYISSRYFTENPFNCGVFILVGDSLDNTICTKNYMSKINAIAQEDQENIEPLYSKILCVSYNTEKNHSDELGLRCELQIKSLKVIMESFNSNHNNLGINSKKS